MLATWIRKTSRHFLSLLALCLAAQQALADSSRYHQSISLGQDGKASLQLTNDSDVPVTAFLIVHFPSLGMEGRDYYDVLIGSHDQLIPPGGSIVRGLSSFTGSESKVRAEVRAVIFKDGSSAGDRVWVNAILARRLRFYDRILSVDDLLGPLVGTGASREAVLGVLRSAEADVDNKLPQDDLRIMDDLIFHGALSTFENNGDAPVDVVLKGYLKYWEKRALTLEYSRPGLDTIRTLPSAIPKPLSDAALPTDFVAARAALAHKTGARPGASLSSCTVLGAQFDVPATQQSDCIDEEDNTSEGYTDNKYTSFSNSDFSYYNASTGKTTDVRWSWSPGPNDLDTATGQCVSYTDCDDAYNIFYKEGSVTGEGAAALTAIKTVEQGQNSQPFYWEFDDYPAPSFSDCDACDPYPDGEENPLSVNTPKAGITFYFAYDCSVSP